MRCVLSGTGSTPVFGCRPDLLALPSSGIALLGGDQVLVDSDDGITNDVATLYFDILLTTDGGWEWRNQGTDRKHPLQNRPGTWFTFSGVYLNKKERRMPWKESRAVDERMKFVVDHLSGRWSKKGLCAHYGISRPTGDKWIRRYEELGPSGVEEWSRRPRHHPWTTPPEVLERIVAYKREHMSFGPRKVMSGLRDRHPGEAWPADSTAGEILKRNGLVKRRRTRWRCGTGRRRARCGARTSRGTSGSGTGRAAIP